MTRKWPAIFSAGFLWMGMAFADPINLITNGSFEEGDWTGANDAWKRLMAGNTSLTGWQIAGVGVDWHNDAHFRPILYGLKAVDLNLDSASMTGTLSQSFTTAPNEWYTLKFSMAAPGNFTDPRVVQVNVAGVVQSFAMNSAHNNYNLSWQDFTLDFLGTGGTTTLMFSNPGGTGAYWGPVLDNIGVEQKFSSVPAPGTLLLLGPAFSLLAGLSLKGKKRYCWPWIKKN